MKFSESWLREWVQPQVDTKALAEQLTMAGLEVDGIEAVAGAFSGVIVGEILAAEQHPDADKLRVCTVAGADGETFQVVCGAPNARAGIKVPFATVGAKLPGDFKIKKAKLRGVESFGMLCAQTELQAGDDDDGLWELPLDAPVGSDLREYLQLDDQVIEVDLTPNRSDCLSLRGLAREVGVLNRVDVTEPDVQAVAATSESTFPVKVDAPEGCPRYLGRVIEGVDVSRPSPLWLQEKLRRSDVRPIDVIVDVTNYVLLELGQPMHAFDLAKLSGGIQVRWAKQGETLELLNDQKAELNSETLVIADEQGALAIAGVMGGAESAVSGATSAIFLESAFFDPIAIAGKARHYGLHTDSSHRFERGVDFELAALAMERATSLILELAGGSAGPVIEQTNAAHLPDVAPVRLRKAQIEKRLGFAIPDSDVVDILTRLGLVLSEEDSEGWQFQVPSYRFDIRIEADLLEELARIYGYNRLPTSTPQIPQFLPNESESERGLTGLYNTLIARGYREVINYSFVDPKLHQNCFGDAAAVSLLNPLSSDMSVMRTSLVPGLLSTLSGNIKRQHSRVRIFERGLRFDCRGPELKQRDTFAGLIYGDADDKHWQMEKRSVDFYDIKGDLEALLADSAGELRFEAQTDAAYLHPGQSAKVLLDGTEIGLIGAVHPQLAKALGIKKAAFVFELELAAVLKAEVPAYTAISRHPEVERDLAFLVAMDTPAAAMQDAIKTAAGENLKQLKVFDIYIGEGIDSQRKSIAFHLTFQHSSRTLNEDEVNAAVESVIVRLKEDFDATLR